MTIYKSYLEKNSKSIYIALFLVFSLFFVTKISSNEVSFDEILISAKSATFNQKLGIIILNEIVILKYENLNFRSDEMELLFEKKSEIENFTSIQKIIARGNVFFERDEEIISSDLVSFVTYENKVKIIGNVKIVKGKNMGFKTEMLEINLKN